MPSVDPQFFFAAFFAGIVTFLAPCTLPLLPAFLGFIGGTSFSEKEQRLIFDRRKVIVHTLLYIIGFSTVFILFGVLAGALGSKIAAYKSALTATGGAAVLLLGLYLLGAFTLPMIPLKWRDRIQLLVKKNSRLASLAFGAALASGWTPCIGPIVGTILLLTSAQGGVLTGAFLLAIFSLGLAIPFFLSALFIARLAPFIQKIGKYLVWTNRVVVALFVGLGVLLLINRLYLLIPWGYKLFRFIEYENILRYL